MTTKTNKHFNARHDDAVWRGFFRRWHAGEAKAALVAEAGVSLDTWSAHARRLGMRLKDLPEGHPARLRAPAFADRADDYRHPRSLLSEGQWRELFRQRAAGVPDTVLSLRFGVHAATICSQAEARGLRRADLRAVAAAALDEAAAASAGAEMEGAAVAPPGGAPDGDPLAGVRIDVADPVGTRARFDAAIAAAGEAANYAKVVLLCSAKEKVERAVLSGFGAGGSGWLGRGGPLHPPSGDPPPAEGAEGGAAAAAPLVLRAAQRAPAGDWATWLFLGGRGAGKTLAGAMWLADMAEAVGPGGRLALIGPTLHDVREVMIEGASGLRSLPRWGAGARPVYEPTRRRLTFPNGATAWAFSAEDPDSLRGPQFQAAWADEFCAWRNGGGGAGVVEDGSAAASFRGRGRRPFGTSRPDAAWRFAHARPRGRSAGSRSGSERPRRER